jgi:hypothetical protein
VLVKYNPQMLQELINEAEEEPPAKARIDDNKPVFFSRLHDTPSLLRKASTEISSPKLIDAATITRNTTGVRE